MQHFRYLVTVLVTFSVMPPLNPGLIECPNHAHVWNAEQCDSFDIDDRPGGGVGGGDGRGFLGDLLHTLSGGLLG